MFIDTIAESMKYFDLLKLTCVILPTFIYETLYEKVVSIRMWLCGSIYHAISKSEPLKLELRNLDELMFYAMA